MNWKILNKYISPLAIAIALTITFSLTIDYFYKSKKIEFIYPKVKIEDLEKISKRLLKEYNIVRKESSQIEQKRIRLKKLPAISLHYCDEERVKNFYNDYFREPTTENLVKEVVTEASGEAGARIPEIFETKLGTKNLNKWIKTIKLPETSISGMFRRYQRETIENHQVSLDLDIVDIELSKVDNFKKVIDSLMNKYNFKFQYTFSHILYYGKRIAVLFFYSFQKRYDIIAFFACDLFIIKDNIRNRI